MVPLRRLRGNALTGSVLASLVIQALNAVTGIILARELGADGRGELAILLLWVGLVAVMGSFGISESTAFHAARGTYERDKVVGTTLVAWLVQSCLLVAVGVVVVQLVVVGDGRDLGMLAYVFLAYVPLWLFGAYSTSLLQGLQAFRSFQFARVFLIVVTAVVLGFFALTGNLSVAEAAAAYLIAYAFTGLVASALIVRAGVRGLAFDGAALRALLGFGARSHTSTVASSLNERLDQFVISVVLAPALLGLYVVAVTLASLTVLVANSVALIALPRVASLSSGPERTDVALRFVRIAVACSALVVAPLVAIADDLLRVLFGTEFAAAATPARILLIASVVLAATRVLAATLRALGEPLRAGTADAVALVVTAIGLVLLLPPFGLAGAAVASLVAYSVSACLMANAVARTLEIAPVHIFLPRPPRGASQPASLRPGSGA